MKRLLFVVCALLPAFVFSQRLPDFGLYRIRINETDKNIVAEIKPSGDNVATNLDKNYYWYSGNTIKITQGGYSGHLLNGNYSEYYLNKNLKEQGVFKKGLKSKVWKSWTDDGKLTSLITWKNGKKNGRFFLYDENGKLKQDGNYTADQLNGVITNYTEKSVPQVTTYKNGVIVTASTNKTFWQKINIFKKIHLFKGRKHKQSQTKSNSLP
jgi:hypothetical protein